jgi:hypothetical protein
MNIVSKILPIRYLGYFDTTRGQFDVTKDIDAIELDSADVIKSTIVNLLFSDGPKTADYLLVTFSGQMFVVERDGPASYCKRLVSYHPLMSKVKLTD